MNAIELLLIPILVVVSIKPRWCDRQDDVRQHEDTEKEDQQETAEHEQSRSKKKRDCDRSAIGMATQKQCVVAKFCKNGSELLLIHIHVCGKKTESTIVTEVATCQGS